MSDFAMSRRSKTIARCANNKYLPAASTRHISLSLRVRSNRSFLFELCYCKHRSFVFHFVCTSVRSLISMNSFDGVMLSDCEPAHLASFVLWFGHLLSSNVLLELYLYNFIVIIRCNKMSVIFRRT